MAETKENKGPAVRPARRNRCAFISHLSSLSTVQRETTAFTELYARHLPTIPSPHPAVSSWAAPSRVLVGGTEPSVSDRAASPPLAPHSHERRQSISNFADASGCRSEEILQLGRQQHNSVMTTIADQRVVMLNHLLPLGSDEGELIKETTAAIRKAVESLIADLRRTRNQRFARACGDAGLLRLLCIPESGRNAHDAADDSGEDTPDEDAQLELARRDPDFALRREQAKMAAAQARRHALRLAQLSSFHMAVERLHGSGMSYEAIVADHPLFTEHMRKLLKAEFRLTEGHVPRGELRAKSTRRRSTVRTSFCFGKRSSLPTMGAGGPAASAAAAPSSTEPSAWVRVREHRTSLTLSNAHLTDPYERPLPPLELRLGSAKAKQLEQGKHMDQIPDNVWWRLLQGVYWPLKVRVLMLGGRCGVGNKRRKREWRVVRAAQTAEKQTTLAQGAVSAFQYASADGAPSRGGGSAEISRPRTVDEALIGAQALRGPHGETALHRCFLKYERVHRVLIRFLLHHYGSTAARADDLRALVNTPYTSLLYHGETVLHFAVMHRDVEMAR